MLHETDGHIMLKQLKCAWPHGLTHMKLVKGDDLRKVAFYVAKYLGKAYQARQIASQLYARLGATTRKGGERQHGTNSV